MTSSYKSRAEATDDRACLELMREALNAAHNAVRLDECRLWTVRSSRGYVSTWGDGQTWMLAVGSFTPAKTGDTATSMRFDERAVHDPVPERIHDADGGAA